jgi:LCP family protein required for cell wall assembly
VQNREKNIVRLKRPKQRSPYRRIFFIILGLLFLGGVIFATRVIFDLSKVSVKNISGGSPLLGNKVQDNQITGLNGGRINILLIGIGGSNHPGGLLADTIMVASVDPVNKSIAFLSIPRDLYVKYPKPAVGSGKINSVYSYGETNKKKIPGGGGALLKQEVADILDVPINYYIRVDFSGFEKIVDALGGVTINVDKAINDPYFPADDTIHYKPFSISKGVHQMNGVTALSYARSRETTSDFDRSRRQQQVMVAMKDKALTLGVLANPIKLVNIIDLVGSHVETDLQTNEMEQLFTILTGVKSESITNGVIDNSTTGPLKDVNMGGYYLVPKLGTNNFSQVQEIAHSLFVNPYLVKENASVSILNGSGLNGGAATLSEKLKAEKYNILAVDTAPEVVTKSIIYDLSKGHMPVTTSLLEKEISATVETKVPANIKEMAPNSDIIVVLGKQYNVKTTTDK